uniref:Proline iminopeptidase n=1 Tax=Palpitomonas bilix TaxID=652834 RepID=A0A7S3GHK7_9EUKA|mmetsp:Transcript_49706/g.127847  ORF Transcript_49706/g.127847 Transcript_49706/m.127847 type:complete len:323 (+) Transcript_49706:100-1068(+)
MPPYSPSLLRSGHLRVSDTHQIYFEQAGKEDGYPVVFLHGGPGAGVDEKCRQFFDPSFYHVVLFDQRGCGKSLPGQGYTEENTTAHLISDMEKLRQHCGVEKWLVFGGSWGSTLALAYAEEHPDRVSGLVLRGIFLGSEEEIGWLYKKGEGKGAHMLYPDEYEKFESAIEEVEEREDIIGAYQKGFTSADADRALRLAKAWSRWEGAVSFLQPSDSLVDEFEVDEFAINFAKIECHYFVNKCFMKEGALLANAEKLQNIPGTIVQGRFDTVCPPRAAFDLHKAWPKSELRIIQNGSHSATEGPMLEALIKATDEFKVVLKKE